MRDLVDKWRRTIFHVERTRSVVRTWTSIRESRSQFKRPASISRKGFSQCINLHLHVRHRPFRCAQFEDAHVARKVVFGIRVEIGVGRCNCHLGIDQ